MNKFLKIGPYSSLKPGLSKYESVRLLLQNKFDPSLDISQVAKYKIDSEYLKKIDFVLYSDSKRSEESFEFIRDKYLNKEIRFKKTNLLDEIYFDISADCSKEQYDRFGSNKIREVFVMKFIQDTLMEKRVEILQRINNLKNEVLQINQEYKNILCISHTFFIKMFQLQIINPELFLNSPNLLKSYIGPEKKIMDFFEIVDIL